MRLGRVVGTCVVSACVEEYEGRKLLVIEPVSREMKPEGRPFVAVDAAGAGSGSEVIWIGGREACYATQEVVPADAAVVAIWEP
ncbi:MAG: ethanolamine utilization protein EutN [Candidatus Coatesbacteria bacterium]|nr:MAG: ethanolamine utilization protein EutN [Candidatus Coatesbacteria bacterium]